MHGNAVLNWKPWGSPVEEFGEYAEAFHRAGKDLVKQLANGGLYRDTDACPIVFMYRHALELALKGTICSGAKLLRLLDKTPPDIQILEDHGLARLVPAVRDVFEAVGWEFDLDVPGLRSFSDLQKFVRRIENMDPKSMSFRYPADKQGQALLRWHYRINVPSYRMDIVLDALTGGIFGLKVMYDQEAEAKSIECQLGAEYL